MAGNVKVIWRDPTVDNVGAPFDPATITDYVIFRDGSTAVNIAENQAAVEADGRRSWVLVGEPSGSHDYTVSANSPSGSGPGIQPEATVLVPSGIPGAGTELEANLQ